MRRAILLLIMEISFIAGCGYLAHMVDETHSSLKAEITKLQSQNSRIGRDLERLWANSAEECDVSTCWERMMDMKDVHK